MNESDGVNSPSPTPDPANTPNTGTGRRYTPEEWQILRIVAQSKGWVWTLRHAILVLEQARMVGQL